MVKSDFFSKKKTFRNALSEYIPALVISFLLHNNLIRKVWVDPINERQHKTPGGNLGGNECFPKLTIT